MQYPFGFLVPETCWSLPDFDRLPQNWNIFSRVCIDTETRDEQLQELGCGARRGAYVVGIALSFDSELTVYLPIRHENGTNLDCNQVLQYVRYNAARFKGTIVGANLSYDLDMLAQEGIEFNNAKRFADVLIAEPLLNELEQGYSLEAVGQRRLGQGKDEALLLEALRAYAPRGTPKGKLKKYLFQVPPECVGPYAEQDVILPLRLLRAQEEAIEDEGLERVWELESKLLPVLVRMRRRGIRINQDRLNSIEEWATREEHKAWEEIARQTGIKLCVGQAMEGKAVAKILDTIGVQYAYGGAKMNLPSIDKYLLAQIEHPVGGLIRWARKMSQLRTTFVASIKTHMINGRVHCTFNQLKKQKENNDDTEGAAFGRLSCSDPNLQQQPAQDPEIGPLWRSVYIPEDGALWASKDYSQQEPKWLVEWACRVPVGHSKGWNNSKLGISFAASCAAREAAARYNENPNLDCYNDFTKAIFGEVTKDLRDRTKRIYLGRVYGMGGPKMARSMGLETVIGRNGEIAGPEAQRLIDAFDDGVPYAKEMATLCQTMAQERGYIRTVSGRKCRFPVAVWNSQSEYSQTASYDWCHKALNRLVQGSSADETKQAIINLDEAGYFIQLQVHDEVNGSYECREDAEEAANIMRNAIPKQLPTKVDLEIGKSWGEAK